MKLRIGDKVKLNKNVEKFTYGRGLVGYDEIGKITRLDRCGDIIVDFPTQRGWMGLKEDLVLVDKKKFFKKLPNNFTGTIEVENGYIVEKEILKRSGHINMNKEILEEEEKEYLSNVIKPFRDKVEYIVKETSSYNEYIKITIKKDDCLSFPYFKRGTMYKGMEEEKEYTLEELGL